MRMRKDVFHNFMQTFHFEFRAIMHLTAEIGLQLIFI